MIFLDSRRKRDITDNLEAGAAPCFVKNTQYGGELIKKIIDIKDAKDCQQLCHRHEDCQFWTHQTNSQICHLKKVKGAKTSEQDMTSGPKVCGK